MLATASLPSTAWFVYHQSARELLKRLKAQLPENEFIAAQGYAEKQELQELAIQLLSLTI